MTDSPQDNISGSETPQAPEEASASFAAPAAGAAPQPLIDGQPAAATEPQYAATATTTTAPAKGRSVKVGIVAALAVGALVGGVSGAGVVAWAVSANSNGSSTTAARKAQNITVNDTSNVNVVAAVAAK